MSLPLLVRPISRAERNFVLSSWKNQVNDDRYKFDWSADLHGDHLWTLLNYVIDHLTLPSCDVFVGCFESEPDVPLCWFAVRDRLVIYSYARQSLRKDPPLAAAVEREMRSRLGVSPENAAFSPFLEMKRCPPPA